MARLVRATPEVFVHLISVLGAVGALAVPLGLMVAEIARGHSRRLIEGLITGLATIGLIEGWTSSWCSSRPVPSTAA